MKMNLPLPLFFLVSLLITFNFQSCADSANTDSTGVDTSVKSKEASKTNPDAVQVKHSEMNAQQHSEFVAKHADHLTSINEKIVEIKNETIAKKDQFNFECDNGSASIDRNYNDAGEVHLLTTTITNGDAISSKHHYYMNDKLIYQFYHHEVKEGDKFVVDDHKTYFNDGVMLKCLEKKYSYKNGEATPNTPYKLVDCNSAEKLTKDIEKLISEPEEAIKNFLCK